MGFGFRVYPEVPCTINKGKSTRSKTGVKAILGDAGKVWFRVLGLGFGVFGFGF